MEKLREIFSALGVENVATHIASGNVIFDVAGKKPVNVANLENLAETALFESLGYDVATLIRSYEDLQSIVDRAPMPDFDPIAGDKLYIGLMKSAPASTVTLTTLCCPINDISCIGRDIYWLRHTARGATKLTYTPIEKALGQKATFRGIDTMSAILDKYRP